MSDAGTSLRSEPPENGSRRDEKPTGPPWRTEGLRGGTPPRRFGPLVLVVLGLLVVNVLLSNWALGPAPRTTVSYSFFVTQVTATTSAR
jgi:cell division protease FtsH